MNKLRLSGFFILLIGIILNIKMYICNEWPTYIFFGLCLFGILLIGLSYLNKSKL
ncbi:hypothetical protein SAMN05192550_3048 [Flavobacterium glycines]|uniref:Gliding motility protein n=1 Tax=Flavobacterium glycines TaxID=551990 RepID=A0A1G8XWC9_9FLAO|nr:hypothetical protein SAMN05192550_3048 [Flavobacterium glycines]